MYLILKALISGIIIALVSELSKKSSLFAAVVISLPISSILALIWLWKDTKNADQVIELSNSIALVIIPSLVFFVAFSLLMGRFAFDFWKSLIISVVIMFVSYSAYVRILKIFEGKLL